MLCVIHTLEQCVNTTHIKKNILYLFKIIFYLRAILKYSHDLES